jgi:hypothetical protein
VAPALHSLIICEREDVVRIVEILVDKHVDLRKLILKRCDLGKHGTSILANITASYPDLEVLSLEGCYPLTSADYCLISRLKKLCELKLSHCQVYYMYVKLLQTHVCICEHMQQNSAINTFCIFRQEENLKHFVKTCHIISVLFSTKWHLFRDFIIFCSKYYIFIKHLLTFKYPLVTVKFIALLQLKTLLHF